MPKHEPEAPATSEPEKTPCGCGDPPTAEQIAVMQAAQRQAARIRHEGVIHLAGELHRILGPDQYHFSHLEVNVAGVSASYVSIGPESSAAGDQDEDDNGAGEGIAAAAKAAGQALAKHTR